MSINWYEVNQALVPIKSFEDACRRCQESFGYSFVRDSFNFTIPELANFTRLVLGGDSRGRYNEYAEMLLSVMDDLQQAGVRNNIDLIGRVETRDKFEAFASEYNLFARPIAELLKYLVYWVIPMKKHLSGLVWSDPDTNHALEVLGELGIRTNLDLLQQGIRRKGRQELVKTSGLSAEVITKWVNLADLSRLPWASKATISNIMGAGYGSLAKLSNAAPEQLFADFFRFGDSIGKNLKLGNEIENSRRIARLVPVLVQDE